MFLIEDSLQHEVMNGLDLHVVVVWFGLFVCFVTASGSIRERH